MTLQLEKPVKSDGALEFNEEQLRAVRHEAGPLLIIAGAGSGKTRVVTGKIARLINEKGVSPGSVLALTFTEKAATEMEERVDRLVPYGYSTVSISTFHSFGDSIIRDNALSIGLVPDFKVLTQTECVIFLKENLYKLPLDIYRPLGDPTRYLSALVSFIGRLKDEDIGPKEYVEFCRSLKPAEPGQEGRSADYVASQTELSLCYEKYTELMTTHGYMDFGDQVTLALRLLRERPDVLKRYQAKYTYILADEFQDTNYAQFELLKLLAGKSGNLTVVADDDQSIYKFRGAAISNVLNFMDVYPEAEQITLGKNYRSVKVILDSSYRLITHNNPDRLEVKSGIDKRLYSVRTAGGAKGVLRHMHFDTLSSEAEWVAQKIISGITENGRTLSDHAVLVRANSDAVPFLKAFDAAGVSYRFSGSSGLYSTEEVRLLICLLRTLTNRNDNLSLFHLASSPVYAIKAEDLVPCHNKARRSHRPLFNVLKDVASGCASGVEISDESRESIKRFMNDMERFTELARNEPTARLLYTFLTDSGYMTTLANSAEPGAERAEQKIRNIARFFEQVSHIESTLSIKSVMAMTEHLSLLMEAGDDPPTAEPDIDEDFVHVMTVHKSKGLEFPVVFMVGLVSERFPRRKRREPLEIPTELIKDTLPTGDFHREEERRLFYVAMTRAMDELYMTGAADYGGVRQKKVSPFVLEATDVQKAAPVKSDPLEAIKRHGLGGTTGDSAAGKAGQSSRSRVVAPTTSKVALAGPLKLSAYQIDDYLTCPQKYRYVHQLKIPLLPHHSIVYGKAVHDAIAYFLMAQTEGQKPTIEQTLDAFKSSWRNEGFVSMEHEQKRFDAGVETLKRFVQRERKRQTRPVSVEKDFIVGIGGDELKGRWDLIEERDDGPYVVDFKTSDVREQKKADKKAKESLQLKLYAYAYKELFGVLPKGCELNFVDTGLVGTAMFDDKALDKMVDQVMGVSEGIRKKEFPATPGYLHCAWCAFANICRESRA